jgi:hypothetical protein
MVRLASEGGEAPHRVKSLELLGLFVISGILTSSLGLCGCGERPLNHVVGQGVGLVGHELGQVAV